MPAKGKHRRPKSQRLSRSMAVAGTGGAALALPLMGATGAHAATTTSAPEKAVQSVPAAEKTVTEKATAKTVSKASGVTTYSVRSGDWLAKIAEEQDVTGGWKKLYQDNREAIGSDPSLIHPGLKLSLGEKASTSGTGASKSSNSSTSSGTSSSSSSSSKSTSASQSDDSTSTSSGYTLPVTGGTIGTGYHVAGSMWSSGYHTGVDFVVPTGTTVKAVAAGTVVSAAYDGAYGNEVVIRHADGEYSQYAHMSQLSVSAGQTVTEGQQIGLSGATGNVTGPHLHFEIRTTPYYGSDVDPVAYLRSHGVTVG
ncbi:LysM peptidoglycan-binding domain-containing M23 family metallopeptidase [Streptomyces sp. N50]|uniref:M23 family metallopeptidase n=1 Tax=Streptomyces sp. N50 TaxID=3081765 RepID=UPI0029621443|nr:LysM peptidoglycan-binding domain-containing M23 family metallopeptidase [Streptomyces sp. N50]WOX14070.1 LysM peptidoglycan-binding domain-containing M23 family metallopeptidase [Streptomyces sp. N50]